MTALFYQAIIILSIIFGFSAGKFFFNSFRLSKLFGFLISLFWIYWTLGGSANFVGVKIRDFSELWFFQLVEAVLTFTLCYGIVNWLDGKDKKIQQQKNTIENLLSDKDRIDNKEVIDYIQANKKVNLKILNNLPQHRQIFYNTLGQATSSICILSGTATSYVINEDFKISLTEALKRGVNVYIGYGYRSSYHNEQKKEYELNAENDLKELVKQAKEQNFKGKIYLAEYKNHSKILICDDDYVVCGSFNWLSNASGQNIERSYIIYDKKLVLKEAQIIKKFIKGNS